MNHISKNRINIYPNKIKNIFDFYLDKSLFLCYPIRVIKSVELYDLQFDMRVWRNWQLRKRAHPVGDEASLLRRISKENYEQL